MINGPLIYFRASFFPIFTQRSFSKGSFIHLATPSPSTPRQPSAGNQHSPCPSIDELLDSAAEELPSAAVLNPEPLWQLEFGSCWQRMQSSTAPVTSNPNDFVLDIGESSSFSSMTSSDVDADFDAARPLRSEASANIAAAYAGRKKKRAMSLDIVGSRRKKAAEALKATPARSETHSPKTPYFPDWEILMLAESMDKDSEEDDKFPSYDPEPEQKSPDAELEPAVTRRRRSLRSSTSVDPQAMSSAKSKKMIEKWYWSYPPPNQEDPGDFSTKRDSGK